jgi:hypothetical protein
MFKFMVSDDEAFAALGETDSPGLCERMWRRRESLEMVRNTDGGWNDRVDNILATKRLVTFGADKRFFLGMCAGMPGEILFLGEGFEAPGAYTLPTGGHYSRMRQKKVQSK